MTNWKKIKFFVKKNNSQAHLAICNSDMFDDTVTNGVYGFPHSGTSRMKSYWRSLASMYNIGSSDLIFLYRTNGNVEGCKQIHGPFKIHERKGIPSIYYDLESSDFPLFIKDITDCKVRFMFEKMSEEVISISDNFELIKKFETRDIWGYRHPAVMNIGAARKKSVTSFTTSQTLIMLDLLENFGICQRNLTYNSLPDKKRINYYDNLTVDYYHYHLDDEFILNNYTDDEAFYYSHIIRALKLNSCPYRSDLMADFWNVNSKMLEKHNITSFADITVNVLLETVVTVHLQDELDVVTTNVDDSALMFFEFKKDYITESSVRQAENYIDLLSVIFPSKKLFANVIGCGLDNETVAVRPRFTDQIKLLQFDVVRETPLQIKFSEAA